MRCLVSLFELQTIFGVMAIFTVEVIVQVLTSLVCKSRIHGEWVSDVPLLSEIVIPRIKGSLARKSVTTEVVDFCRSIFPLEHSLHCCLLLGLFVASGESSELHR